MKRPLSPGPDELTPSVRKWISLQASDQVALSITPILDLTLISFAREQAPPGGPDWPSSWSQAGSRSRSPHGLGSRWATLSPSVRFFSFLSFTVSFRFVSLRFHFISFSFSFFFFVLFFFADRFPLSFWDRVLGPLGFFQTGHAPLGGPHITCVTRETRRRRPARLLPPFDARRDSRHSSTVAMRCVLGVPHLMCAFFSFSFFFSNL
jgi:hypothetical protein